MNVISKIKKIIKIQLKLQHPNLATYDEQERGKNISGDQVDVWELTTNKPL